MMGTWQPPRIPLGLVQQPQQKEKHMGQPKHQQSGEDQRRKIKVYHPSQSPVCKLKSDEKMFDFITVKATKPKKDGGDEEEEEERG